MILMLYACFVYIFSPFKNKNLIIGKIKQVEINIKL